MHQATIGVESTYDETGENGFARFIITLKSGKNHLSEHQILKNYKSSEDISSYAAPSYESVQPVSSVENETRTEAIADETILIVEDNNEVRKLLVSIFKDHYIILEASNGAEGIALSRERVPSLIISDIMMPGIDGIKFCREIKSSIQTSHIPVILLTARTAVTFKYEGLETGADDYITKPFNVEEIKLRVANLINQRKNLRELFSKTPSFLPSEITITSIDEKLMQKSIDFIIDHLTDENLTVERVAKEVGLSRASFYRKIKAITNLGAAKFIRTIRIEHAAQLLRTNRFRVSEVGSLVGFSDMDYFRNCFKLRFGVTPSEYIKTAVDTLSE